MGIPQLPNNHLLPLVRHPNRLSRSPWQRAQYCPILRPHPRQHRRPQIARRTRHHRILGRRFPQRGNLSRIIRPPHSDHRSDQRHPSRELLRRNFRRRACGVWRSVQFEARQVVGGEG